MVTLFFGYQFGILAENQFFLRWVNVGEHEEVSMDKKISKWGKWGLNFYLGGLNPLKKVFVECGIYNRD